RTEALPAIDQAFALPRLQRAPHRNPTDPEPLPEIALRRQLIIRRKSPLLDTRTQPVRDLLVIRPAGSQSTRAHRIGSSPVADGSTCHSLHYRTRTEGAQALYSGDVIQSCPIARNSVLRTIQYVVNIPALLIAAAFVIASCSSRPPDASDPAAQARRGVPSDAGETPPSNVDWAHYLGDPHSTQYSTLDQINRENVHLLEIAWMYDTGDSAEYQSNNLIVDGILYSATPYRRVVALDAATGEHLWTFDPDEHNPYGGNMYQGGGRQRGVMYWEDGDDRRIYTVKGPWMYAIDASTGALAPEFGEGGWIHLGDGMDVEGRPNVGLNTPGYVYRDMIIIGANVAEDVPGAIRAFDARTG